MSTRRSTVVKVPEIVVTEPTPAPVEDVAADAPSNMPQPQASTDPAQAGVSDSPSDVARSVVMPIPKQPAVAVSGGFSPLVDHQECTVTVDSNNPNVDPEGGSSHGFRRQQQQTQSARFDRFTEYCYRKACDFRESKNMLLVQVFFLIIPITTAYMGGVNFDNCPMSPTVPILVFMLGITGCMVMVFQIVMLMQKLYINGRVYNYIMRNVTNYGYAAMFVLLFTEMVSFHGTRYSDPTDVDYCEYYFYYYTYWMNWSGFFFILLMIASCAPHVCVTNMCVER